VPRREPGAVETEELSLIDGPLEGAPRRHVGEVDERAGGLCYWDAGAVGHVVGQLRLVHDQPGPAPPRVDRHVDLPASVVEQAPQNGSTEVAQGGFVSAGEHSGHEPPVPREVRIAHDVDTAMHTVEPPPPHPPIDRVLAQAQGPELSTANDPVLPPGELRNHPVHGVLRQFSAHIADK
jgi:hypothetical protein